MFMSPRMFAKNLTLKTGGAGFQNTPPSVWGASKIEGENFGPSAPRKGGDTCRAEWWLFCGVTTLQPLQGGYKMEL